MVVVVGAVIVEHVAIVFAFQRGIIIVAVRCMSSIAAAGIEGI